MRHTYTLSIVYYLLNLTNLTRMENILKISSHTHTHKHREREKGKKNHMMQLKINKRKRTEKTQIKMNE